MLSKAKPSSGMEKLSVCWNLIIVDDAKTIFFCVVMAETSEDEAMAAADRLRANVESMPLLADAGVTVTVGVAVGSEADLAASIARAERAVSSAHAANRVIWADDTPPD